MPNQQKSLPASPGWVKDAVFYQVFPDRFRRGVSSPNLGVMEPWGATPTTHNFMGGTLRGILEGLDHIQELGCNALYLCPIFSSTANHRYHTNDYFRIDPLLGSEQDFDDLVNEVHHRKMWIILDGVFNHCSRGLYQFNSLLELGEESPFRDWFLVDSFPLRAYGDSPNYRCWWNLPALPKFNTANSQVREFLWSVGEYWMKRGINGWRLDVPNEIDDDRFWQEFRKRVKAVNEEAYIVGEIWSEPSRWLAGDQFDGVMNYEARRAILETLFPDAMRRPENLSTGEPEAVLHQGSAEYLQNQAARKLCNDLLHAFPHDRYGIPFNLLGSHDNMRMATLGKDWPEHQDLAWALLCFLPGTVCIYQGDELGQEGGKDPDNRRCFPWQNLVALKKSARFQGLAELIALRRRYACLRHGSFGCRPDGNGVILWRELGSERLELRIGYPGQVGLAPSREVVWDEILSARTEGIPGLAGRMVNPGGWQIIRVKTSK
jgi:glycosidase